MSAVVVDASVGIKWFVPEIHSNEARQWRNGPDELCWVQDVPKVP